MLHQSPVLPLATGRSVFPTIVCGTSFSTVLSTIFSTYLWGDTRHDPSNDLVHSFPLVLTSWIAQLYPDHQPELAT